MDQNPIIFARLWSAVVEIWQQMRATGMATTALHAKPLLLSQNGQFIFGAAILGKVLAACKPLLRGPVAKP